MDKVNPLPYVQSESPAVLALLPQGLPPTSGNWVSALRLKDELASLGWTMTCTDAGDARAAFIRDGRAGENPGYSLVHAFHIVHTGPLGHRLSRSWQVPLVVSATGTDLNHYLRRETAGSGSHRRPSGQDVRQVLAGTDALVVYLVDSRQRLLELFPSLEGRVHVIPPGCRVLPAAGRTRATWNLPEDSFVVLFAGGLRPVKRPLFALEPLSTLREQLDRPLHLLYAGPPRHEGTVRQLVKQAASLPWVRLLGEVPYEEMGDLYRAADCVINTSRSEGLSNALLEAMALGCAVVASDVPGNRSLIQHKRTGLLFAGRDGLAAAVGALAADPEFRRRLGRRAREHARTSFRREAEAAGFASLFDRLLTAEGT